MMNVRSCKDDVYIWDVQIFFSGTVLLKVSRSWCQLGPVVRKKNTIISKKKKWKHRLLMLDRAACIGSFMSSVLLFLAEANELVSLHW